MDWVSFALVFSIVPAATAVLAFTNDSHHLFWILTGEFDPASKVFKASGVGLRIFIYYSVAVTAITVAILIRSLGRYRRMLVWQSRLIGLAAFVPLFFVVVEQLFEIHPFEPMQITPLAFTLGMWIVAWMITRLRRVDIVSVSRERVLEQMGDGLVVVDEEGRLLDTNRQGLELMGKEKQGALGQALAKLWPELWEHLAKMAIGEESNADMVLFGGSEEVRIYDVLLSPLSDWRGRVVSRVMVLRNVTERRRTERALEANAEKLKVRNEELQQFAYAASHDLQEPLRMVVSYLDLLRNQHEDISEEIVDEFMGYASEGAKRMQELLKDLTIYARVGTQGRDFEEVDIGDLLDQVLRDLKVAVDESDGEVTRDDLPVVRGDRVQLGQVFQNLLSNALKFRSRNRRLELHVGVSREVEGWVFSIKDNGIGIGGEHREKVFQIFHRLNAREEYEGSGIGLAICKRIVGRHGGRIWLESEPERGSTFLFLLPVASP